MREKTVQELLKETFIQSGTVAWSEAASLELGKEPLDTIHWSSADGLVFEAYYDKSTTASLDYLKKFQNLPSTSYLGSRAWLNIPQVHVQEAKVSNEAALDHLKNGADGVHFILHKDVDLSELLQEIEWAFCFLAFSIEGNRSSVSSLIRFIEQYEPHVLHGALFSRAISDIPLAGLSSLQHQKNLAFGGWFVDGPSPVSQIVHALQSGTTFLTSSAEEKISPEEAVRHLIFSFELQQDFFLSIAMLKAFRILWFQVVQAFGMQSYRYTDVKIHARIKPWTKESYQPHANMLNSTTTSMAAILGGCDMLSIIPEDGGNSMMNRVARNISNILREESHFDKVADAVAGSYYVDTLVDKLARSAWEAFQQSQQ